VEFKNMPYEAVWRNGNENYFGKWYSTNFLLLFLSYQQRNK
jgi:hypothetical protein